MSLISFSKRKREFATLRAIGTENRRVFSTLLSEAATEYIPGCVFASPGIFAVDNHTAK